MPPIRVLVVDDADDLRGVVRMLLELEDDFEVVAEAGNGVDAVRLCREHRPDLVVLDVAMPHMDGIATLEQVRHVSPASKVVMFSANDSARMLQDAVDHGASGFIDKATGVIDLVGRLRTICLPA